MTNDETLAAFRAADALLERHFILNQRDVATGSAGALPPGLEAIPALRLGGGATP